MAGKHVCHLDGLLVAAGGPFAFAAVVIVVNVARGAIPEHTDALRVEVALYEPVEVPKIIRGDGEAVIRANVVQHKVRDGGDSTAVFSFHV